ncbi:translocation/assembly module TamB domain-containing protein, partial [Bacteroidota bacterium]
LAHHLPSFRNIVGDTNEYVESQNNFTYSFHFKNTFPITNFFYPDVEIARNSMISGNYFPAQHEFILAGDFPDLRWKNISYVGLKLNLVSEDSIARIQTSSEVFNAGSRIHMENLRTEASAFRDEFLYRVDWNNHNPDELYRGEISGQAALLYSQLQILPQIDLHLNEGEVVLGDSVWRFSPGHVTIDTTSFSFENFNISHRKQAFGVSGIISKNPYDELHLSFRELDLELISEAYEGLDFSGILRGSSTISGVYDNLLFISDLSIDSLSINQEMLGNTFIRTNWISPENKIRVDLKAMRGTLNTLNVEGEYFPQEKNIDFNVSLDKLKLNIFQPYLAKLFSNVEGTSSGNINLTGSLDKPVMNGEIRLQKTSFILDYIQTQYSFSDRVEIKNSNFLFSDLEVFDKMGSRALLNGSIETNYLRDMKVNLDLQADNFIVVNTRETNNQMYYGYAIASGRMGLIGSPGDLRMQISARTEKGTHMFIPINQGQEIKENNFITFVHADQEEVRSNTDEKYSVDLGRFMLDFNLEITEDAIIEIIFDPKVGDIMQANGEGNIQLSIDPQNGFQMFGDYTIESGEYLFTLQNIINKKLKIQRGSTISWNGDPTAAIIDMQAIYNSKAAPGALVPDPPENLKNRMPVECHLIMEGNLMSPIISFDIVLPTAEEETRNVVRNAITTDEELTKQFLSLLVINNFSSVAAPTGGSPASTGAMAGVTASELLSNQLSNWLSQISNDFDIGVNYRPGDEISSDQVEVALSTQILDDRVSIHTNVDVSAGNNAAVTGQKTSAIAGDFDVELKLTDNGRLRMKAYNRYNHDQLYKTSDYTQGVGFVYREDFNNFGELGRRYVDAITGKNRKKKKRDKDIDGNTDPSPGAN